MTPLEQVTTECYWCVRSPDQRLLRTCWVSTVMRGRVEVSMGDGGRDGIPRESGGGGGGEGELNVSTATERETQKPRGEKRNRSKHTHTHTHRSVFLAV